ncbi:MAG: DUF892 family protein [Steroidobacteraceae bacterium]|jgi:ferritin-like metal-binding protein YciE|nr:DUF892 family protein [Steroidobacteraceae bacterium]
MAQSIGSERPHRPDNVAPIERWASALAGLGLMASAARVRGVLGRLTLGYAGLSLMARGATGYCPVKAAMQGQSTMREGLQEQWSRLTDGVSESAGAARRRVRHFRSPRIESMEDMYRAELQELHSAEQQLIELTLELMRVISDSPLAFRVQEYGAELQSRKEDLENIMTRIGAERGRHPDDAMQALIRESRKMASVREGAMRDAALASSLQRIIHYKIAGYGTIAAYAKALGRGDDARHFAQLADRDKTIDAEISDLAKRTLNPEAAIASQEAAPTTSSEMRTH